MIDLAKKRSRLLIIIEKYKGLYRYSTKEEQFLISSSLLNFIWNSWSSFWRDYWIVYTTGGIDIAKKIVVGIHPDLDCSQACAYVNQYARIRYRYSYGDRITHFSEPTWGDTSIITNIASGLVSNIPQMSYLISLIPIYKNELDDFQKIRNSFIHLNKNAIKQLDMMRPNYIFAPNQSILDILNTKRLGKTNICFYSMLDTMSGLLINLS